MRQLAALLAVLIAIVAYVGFRGSAVGPGPTRTGPTQGEAPSAPGPTELAGPDIGGARVDATSPLTEPPGADPPAQLTPAPDPALGVHVMVINAWTLEPMPGLRLSIQSPLGARAVTTDELGHAFLTCVPEDSGMTRGLSGTWSFELVGVDPDTQLVEHAFVIAETSQPSTQRIDLRVTTKTRLLTVELIPPPGEPVACEVYFCSVGAFLEQAQLPRIETPPGLEPAPVRDADEGPYVHVFPYSNDADIHGFRIWATAANGYVSEPLSFEAGTLPGRVQVRMIPAASMSVRVWRATGELETDRRVRLIPHSSISAIAAPELVRTDDEGIARFENLFPVQTDIAISLPGGGFAIHETVTLRSADDLTVDVHLGPELPLAVSGIVLDEGGLPLADQVVAVQLIGVPAWWSEDVVTDDRGAFRYFGPACDVVIVNASLGALGDLFDPAEQHVQHGTKDVTFRRSTQAQECAFTVLAIDSKTLEPIGDIIATFDRGPGTERWSNTYAARTSFSVPVLPDTRIRIAAAGYSVATVSLKEALDALANEAPLEVQLEPGLHHTLLVLDADSGLPLAGVRMTGASGHVVTSDANGHVPFTNAPWEVYVATHAGHANQEWDPSDSVLFAWGALHLMVAEPDSSATEGDD